MLGQVKYVGIVNVNTFVRLKNKVPDALCLRAKSIYYVRMKMMVLSHLILQTEENDGLSFIKHMESP